MESHCLPLLRVTKGSTDGTVQEGDVVYYGDDGSLNLVGSVGKYNTKWGGWLDKYIVIAAPVVVAPETNVGRMIEKGIILVDLEVKKYDREANE